MALVHEARLGICADNVPGGGDPAFVKLQRGVKWIHAAARHAVLYGACRGR